MISIVSVLITVAALLPAFYDRYFLGNRDMEFYVKAEDVGGKPIDGMKLIIRGRYAGFSLPIPWSPPGGGTKTVNAGTDINGMAHVRLHGWMVEMADYGKIGYKYVREEQADYNFSNKNRVGTKEKPAHIWFSKILE